MKTIAQGFLTWGVGTPGGHETLKGKFKKTTNDFFNMGREIIIKYQQIRSQNLKMIIMTMVNIGVWGFPNVHYLDMGVAGQKGWETLPKG